MSASSPVPGSPDTGKGGMDAFLTLAIESILKDNITKKNNRLRESCTSTLDLLKEIGVTPKSKKREHIEQSDTVINKLIITLKIACESRYPRIMSKALDCLQKLMAHGYIRPSIRDIEKPEAKLMDKVIEVIGDCFDTTDDDVQLQIMKAFLTAVSSTHCDVHGHALVNAIRACFNIYLVSRNRDNQATAKGTLTQMLGIIFQRFEVAATFAQEEKDRASEQGYEMTVELPSEPVSRPLAAEGSSSDPMQRGQEMEDIFLEAIASDDQDILPLESTEEVVDRMETSVSTSPSATEENARSVVVDALNDEKKRESFSEETDSQLDEDAHVQTSEDDSTLPAHEDSEETPVTNQGHSVHVATGQAAVNVAYNDCSGIFKALCKLSSKELPASISVDSVDMRRKLLALQLIDSIIEHAGPMLRANERFVNNAIKKYLFISLLLNGVSPFIKVFRTSLSIFYGLIAKFKDNLRNQIGVYFSKIILRILGSSNSSTQHKHVVLQLLLKICKEAQILVDIFLNFDCNLDSADIFERIVNDLSGIAKGTYIATGAPLTQQEASVRLLGLECTVTIMRSLVQWSSDLPEQLEAPATQDQENNDPHSPLVKPGKVDPIAESEENTDKLDSFTKQKQWKQQVENGKQLFNTKPKKGIQYLIDIGHIPNTSKGVAQFLLGAEGLDRTNIGEYIGDISNPFCKSVLYDYIDLQHFKDMEFYTALRRFLLGFRLPGEGQKIDVIMEKFAERYYNDNKKEVEDAAFIFANADAVYLFAYHTIMLATDLHSPAIKKKLSKAEWIKNNNNLNDGKDFPEKFLVDLYDTVAKYPLKVRDDDTNSSARLSHSELLSPKQRQMLFHKESESIVQRSQELIQQQLQKKTTFFKSTNIKHVKPMFEMCWCPMLAALSMNLETSQDTDRDVYQLCLEGFRCGIRVSSIFYMETERNAFVSSLSQFTLLSNMREMKQKNIEAIKCLIEIANSDGNYLQDSWTQVLRCISQLAKIHILGSTRISTDLPSPNSTGNVQRGTGTATRRTDSMGTIKMFENINATSVAEQINVDEIDKIFSNTVQLNDNAIVYFVKCLCSVSQSEVENSDPRTFSLQKLIEIAYYNMTRIRFVWTRIWGIMADHFKTVGCHSNKQVSMYAVDSLRQLAMKFLEKDELANYHFQKDFLKPFEYIIACNRALAVRELVVRCLTQMILARGSNIKSGWKSIFMVFTAAAGENDQSVGLAFEITQKILTDYFSLISSAFFVECVNCFVAFAKNKNLMETSIQAIVSLSVCSDHLARGDVFDLETSEDGVAFTESEHHLKHWFPILTGLSQVVAHPHVDVRSKALDTLFDILFKYGSLFSVGLWELIFRGVLFPIFDNVRHSGDGSLLKEDNEWLTSTCLNALSLFAKLYSHYFERVHFLLDDCLALLYSCMLQENQQLASIGSTCFLQMVLDNTTKWSNDMWWKICFTLRQVITHNRSSELLSIISSESPSHEVPEPTQPFIPPQSTPASPEETLESKLDKATPGKFFPYDIHVITGKSNVLLQLLTAIQEIVRNNFERFEVRHLQMILETLNEVHAFAHQVNSVQDLWQAPGKSAILPLTIKQENLSVSLSMEILFGMYAGGNSDRVQSAENPLIQLVLNLLVDYYSQDVDNKASRYTAAKVPTLIQSLDGLGNLTDDQFLLHLPTIYPGLSNLVMVHDKQVRMHTKALFHRIGKLHRFSQGNISVASR